MIVGGTPTVKYRSCVESLSVAFLYHLLLLVRRFVCTLIRSGLYHNALKNTTFNMFQKSLLPSYTTQHIDPLAFKLTSVPWFPHGQRKSVLLCPKPAFKLPAA